MAGSAAPLLGELGQIAHVVGALDRAVTFFRDAVGLTPLF